MAIPHTRVTRFSLSFLFAVSAIAKIGSIDQTREAIRGFGLPNRLSRPGALLLPVAEVMLSTGLLSSKTATQSAQISRLLLGAFNVLLLRTIRGKKEVDCNCFGSLTPEAPAWTAVVRNVGLSLMGMSISRPKGMFPAFIPSVELAALLVGLLIPLSKADSQNDSYTALSKNDANPVNLDGPKGRAILQLDVGHDFLNMVEVSQDPVGVCFVSLSCFECIKVIRDLDDQPSPPVLIFPYEPSEEDFERVKLPKEVKWIVDNERVLFKEFGVQHIPACFKATRPKSLEFFPR